MSDFFSFLPIYPSQLLILIGKLILGQVCPGSQYLKI